MDYKNIDTTKICKIAVGAGLITLKYHKKITQYDEKNDGSEVTIADKEANDFICKNLKKHFPKIAIVSEESSEEENYSAIKNNAYFIIDPLDGTRNFIKGGDNYTINIALIFNKKTVLGFIYVPARDILYFTKDEKSYKIDSAKNSQTYEEAQIIKVSDNVDELKMIGTKREPEKTEIIRWANLKSLKIKETVSLSSSYKFCIIAQGQADIYPRMINIKFWDIAAGHAIIKNAGGDVIDQKTQKEVIYDGGFDAPKFIAYNSKMEILKL